MESLDHETPEARAAFLDGACRGNSPMRGRLEALLADQPDSGGRRREKNSLPSPAFDTPGSADGRRLLSASGAREPVKLWDTATRQELLTFAGTGSLLATKWSADGDVIVAGPPWQSWRAPSWEEIAAAEAKEKRESNQP